MYQNRVAILNILTFKTGCSAFRLSYPDIIRNVDARGEGESEAFRKIDSFVDELKAEARYIKNTRERERCTEIQRTWWLRVLSIGSDSRHALRAEVFLVQTLYCWKDKHITLVTPSSGLTHFAQIILQSMKWSAKVVSVVIPWAAPTLRFWWSELP